MQKNTIIGIVVLALVAVGLVALFRDPDVDSNLSGDTSALDGSNQLGNPLQAGASTDDAYDENGNLLTDDEQSIADEIQAEGK